MRTVESQSCTAKQESISIIIFKFFVWSFYETKIEKMAEAAGKRAKKRSLSKQREKHLLDIEKKFISRVYDWVSIAIDRERRKENVFVTYNKAEETAKICGVSKRHVYRLKNNQPNEERTSKGRPKISIDNFDKAALSRLVHKFYI